jgi:hypothetical protein
MSNETSILVLILDSAVLYFRLQSQQSMKNLCVLVNTYRPALSVHAELNRQKTSCTRRTYIYIYIYIFLSYHLERGHQHSTMQHLTHNKLPQPSHRAVWIKWCNTWQKLLQSLCAWIHNFNSYDLSYLTWSKGTFSQHHLIAKADFPSKRTSWLFPIIGHLFPVYSWVLLLILTVLNGSWLRYGGLSRLDEVPRSQLGFVLIL